MAFRDIKHPPTSSRVDLVCIGYWFVGAILCICALAKSQVLETSSQPSDGDAASRTARAAISSRLALLQNLDVSYKTNCTYSPDVNHLRNYFGANVHPLSGTRNWDEEFTFLHDRAEFSRRFLSGFPEAEVNGDKIDSVSIFTPERVETFDRANADRVAPVGSIAERGRLPVSVIDPALGLRLYGQEQWLTDKDIAVFKVDSRNDGTVVARSEADANGIAHEWDFQISSGLCLVDYKVYSRGLLFHEYIGSDFHSSGGVTLPYRITFRDSYWDGDKQFICETDDISVKKYILNDPQNTSERYIMRWPVGTRVFDERNKLELVVKSTTRPIDDDTIYDVIKKESSGTPPAPESPK